MKKKPIGILDGGLEGINIFEKLSLNYPNESFIYINDLKNYPYEEKEVEAIQKYVQKSIDVLLEKNVSAIFVVCNSIIEYCEELLDKLTIPVIKINEVVINYVNSFYEHKNIAFIAKQYIIKANIYQKNFKYNHLYNIASDELENLIFKKQVKTGKSFQKMQDVLKPVNNKDVNLVVYTDSFLENLNIEFKEYINGCNFLDLPEIMFNEYKNKVITNKDSNKQVDNKNVVNNEKGKGKKIVISQIPKSEFINFTYWISENLSYKYIKIENKKHGIK